MLQHYGRVGIRMKITFRVRVMVTDRLMANVAKVRIWVADRVETE